jgi:acyl-CoA reductase-like NAD-dependent aldehyde dehydrogenase
MKARDDEEAITLMNDIYGPTASIWTCDRSRRWLGSRIETGTVYMNRCDYLTASGLDRRQIPGRRDSSKYGFDG